MDIFIYTLLFIFGTCVASFLGASAYRIEKGYKYTDFILLPSSCEKCNRNLNIIDLIPIIGYLYNLGKCRSCGNGVNMFYPMSELFLGISFVVLYYLNAPIYLYFVQISLLFLSFFDIESMSIPKGVTDAITIVFVLVYIIFIPKSLTVLFLLLSIVIIFLIINLIKKSFGIGDIIIIVYSSLFLNTTYILHYLFSIVLIGSVISVLLILLKKLNIKDYIPLLPIITLSYLVTIIFMINDVNIFNLILELFAQLFVL